jgi:hypothetical protein
MKIARSLKVFEITGTNSSFILGIRIDISLENKIQRTAHHGYQLLEHNNWLVNTGMGFFLKLSYYYMSGS